MMTWVNTQHIDCYCIKGFLMLYSSAIVDLCLFHNGHQSSKLTDAKTLNACKKCQLRLQILEQGKILRLDIVSPRYKVLLRNSRRQPFI